MQRNSFQKQFFVGVEVKIDVGLRLIKRIGVINMNGAVDLNFYQWKEFATKSDIM